MAYRETAATKAHKDSRREHLFTTAETLVREGGFAALTMQALATRAGVSVGTLYRYFKNKDQLAVAIFNQATAREVEALRLDMQRQGKVVERLHHAVVQFAKRAQSAPVLTRALIAEPVDPEVDQARNLYRRRYAGIFEKLLEQGIANGELTQQPVALTAAATVGAIAEALAGPLGDPLEEQKLPEQLALFIVRACGVNE